jgi:hypothetical protein
MHQWEQNFLTWNEKQIAEIQSAGRSNNNCHTDQANNMYSKMNTYNRRVTIMDNNFKIRILDAISTLTQNKTWLKLLYRRHCLFVFGNRKVLNKDALHFDLESAICWNNAEKASLSHSLFTLSNSDRTNISGFLIRPFWWIRVQSSSHRRNRLESNHATGSTE